MKIRVSLVRFRDRALRNPPTGNLGGYCRFGGRLPLPCGYDISDIDATDVWMEHNPRVALRAFAEPAIKSYVLTPITPTASPQRRKIRRGDGASAPSAGNYPSAGRGARTAATSAARSPSTPHECQHGAMSTMPLALASCQRRSHIQPPAFWGLWRSRLLRPGLAAS